MTEALKPFYLIVIDSSESNGIYVNRFYSQIKYDSPEAASNDFQAAMKQHPNTQIYLVKSYTVGIQKQVIIEESINNF